MKKIILVILLLGASLPAIAKLKTYKYDESLRRSQFYTVVVQQANIKEELFVHISECPDGSFADHKIWITEQDRSVSFAQFDFDAEPVKVTVTKTFGKAAHNVEITPKRYGVIIDSFDGYSVTFTLEHPEYVSVRFVCDDNTDEFNNIKNALMIFADEPEKDAPKITDENVTIFEKNANLIDAEIIYFKPGVYNLFDYLPNGNLLLHDNQAIYVAGGAYIYGIITGAATYNCKIFGRGIISGFKHGFHYDGQRQLIEMDRTNYRINTKRGSNHTIEGVCFIESVNHTLVVPNNSLVKDVKFISWACNNDGLRSGDGSVVDHVFMKLCDDYFYATTNTLITRSILWPMFNGGILQLGWGNRDHKGGCRFINNDIINPEWDWIGANTGFIASQIKPDATIKDVLIEDVHIDGDINALAALDFATVPGKKYNFSGYIKNFTFRNIEVNGKQIWWGKRGWDGYERLETQLSRDYNISKKYPAILGKSFVKGIADSNGNTTYIENIIFENIKINGEWVTENNYKKYFYIDSSTTKNIKFIRNKELTFADRPKSKSVKEYAEKGIGANKKFKNPLNGQQVNWLTKGDEYQFKINVPENGEYELRYAFAPLYGNANINLTINNSTVETVYLKEFTDNSSLNIKRVLKNKIKLNKGLNIFTVKVKSGNVYPDLIEIVPPGAPKGTDDYLVYTHWHGVIRTTETNWHSEHLYFDIDNNILKCRFYERANSNISFSEQPNNYTIKIFNNKGNLLSKKEMDKNSSNINIEYFEPGSYTATISNKNNYWISKRFVVPSIGD